MPNVAYRLFWIAPSIANLMHSRGIRSRRHLAEVLGMSASSINNTFDENWAGEATLQVLTQMAGTFRVPLGQLVVEPGLGGKRIIAGQRGSVRPSAAETSPMLVANDRKPGQR